MRVFSYRFATVALATSFLAGASVCQAQTLATAPLIPVAAASADSAPVPPILPNEATGFPSALPPAPGAISTSIAAQLQAPASRRRRRVLPLFGPDFEVSRLFSSKTRRTFGASTFSIGPGFGKIAPGLKAEIGPDISVTSTSKTLGGNRNKLFVLAIGPEFRRAYVPPKILRQIKEAQRQGAEAAAQAQAGGTPASGPATGGPSQGGPPPGFGGPPPVVPYYGASLQALYAKVKVPGIGLNNSGYGAGASVFAGVAIKSRAFVELRLRATTSVKGYNFSRAGVTFGLRF